MIPKELYVDKDFPGNWTSLKKPHDAVTWKRPHEIVEKPMLFVDGSSRFDINQGRLGDCWFIAACAAVAERPDLIKKVVPEGQVLYGPGYDGSVRFRFWNLDTWKEVRIDDYLPVDAKNKPVYVHCKSENEFWMPLLEKAFARMYGKYRLIEGGLCCEGLMKLTGFSLEYLEFRNWSFDEDFHKIKNGFENNGVVVIGTGWGGPGVPGSHAYTATKTFYVAKEENRGEELRLVRVRNPWGTKVEWKGAWKDGDERWNNLSEETRKHLEYNPGDDGEYWMDMKDVVANFSDGSVLTPKPKACANMKIVQQIKGRWDDQTAGGSFTDVETFATNPQYLLMVVGEENVILGYQKSADEVEMYVELIMEDDRTNDPNLLPGLFIFEGLISEKKLTGEDLLKARPVGGVKFKATVGRRCRVLLQRGRAYVIVAATETGNPGENFLLRIYSINSRIVLKELKA